MSQTLELIRVRGQVQGVGFRPAVSRLATQLGLRGWVKNDADGVLIALGGATALREHFVRALLADLPPLARVQEVEPAGCDLASAALTGFEIVGSSGVQESPPRAQVAPDAAVCAACSAEVLDPEARRYAYPLTNCTHCGPRFSIAHSLPWDRARTSMAAFEPCAACRAEYESPSDRRYHAEPIACPACGPRATLTRLDGQPFTPAVSNVFDALTGLLEAGAIVALKGLGGYQLLADATRQSVVERLRRRKQRPDKPFALMARDLDVVRAYCVVSAEEQRALLHPSAPIVLLRARARAAPLAAALSPLPPCAAVMHGFMLPTTPLHLLALRGMARPVVCTSGNRSQEPQVCDDAQVPERLGQIADWVLSHDRPIQHRVDDSVVRVFAGKRRVLRRARGLAPAPRPLPPGFAAVAERAAVFAAGADLKAAICLSRTHDLVLSQHLGDLDDTHGYLAYLEQSARLSALFEHRPTHVVADNHPDSRAAQHAAQLAAALERPLSTVQHHHAHFAACLGENAVPLDSERVLGLVLDGSGAADDARSVWGCELFAGGYAAVERLGTLLPSPLLGGDRAAREPWRCLYAQLKAALAPGELAAQLSASEALAPLRSKPLALLDAMFERGLGSPPASSCGRLFDAVAAALGVCFERQSFEAQAALALEALATPRQLAAARAERPHAGYAFALSTHPSGLLRLDPRPLWPPLLADLAAGTPPGRIAARFHVALAAGLAQLCAAASARPAQVALSGGCLQNAVLHACLHAELTARGFTVLSHADVPANDGGIAFGQALVTLARIAAEMER